MGEQTMDLDTTPARESAPDAQASRQLPEASGGHPMEIWISYVLRVGVLLAAAIIVTGLIWFLAAGAPGGPTTLNQLLGGGGHSIVVSPRTIISGIGAGNPIAVIQLGVLVLILTPTSRVAMTVILFLVQKDRIFVAVTLTVLLVLIFGLVGFGS